MARAVGRPVLLRLHLVLPDLDPWDFASLEAPDRRPMMAWSSPDGARSFVGIDVARRIEVSGSGRFRHASEACADTAQHRLDRPWRAGDLLDRDIPLCVGGFAFTPTEAHESAAPWRGWGDGLLWVPRLGVHRAHGRTTAVLSYEVWPEVDEDALAERLEGGINRVLGAASRAWIEGSFGPDQASDGTIEDHSPESAHRRWLTLVGRAASQMRPDAAGSLRKVVLARQHRFVATGAHFDPLATARALRRRHGDCTTFLVARPDGSAFLGASPEPLVSLRGDEVRTVALAGTAPRGDTPAQDDAFGQALLDSAKEQEEHRLVVEGIRDALSPLVTDLTFDPSARLERFAQIQHLKTSVRARVRGRTDLLALVDRLHPTPAVGGWPRRDALDWLARHEGLDRGWYAGPIGWIGPEGSGEFVVGIRAALLRGGEAWAFAGCGLVPASDPEAEWRETLTKLQTIGDALTTGPPMSSGEEVP